MHDHHVAHRSVLFSWRLYLRSSHLSDRDLAYYNVMMDGTALYPKGFHPDRPERSRSATHIIKGRYRLHSPPVSYYFIDFDLSSKYEDDLWVGPWMAGIETLLNSKNIGLDLTILLRWTSSHWETSTKRRS